MTRIARRSAFAYQPAASVLKQPQPGRRVVDFPVFGANPLSASRDPWTRGRRVRRLSEAWMATARTPPVGVPAAREVWCTGLISKFLLTMHPILRQPTVRFHHGFRSVCPGEYPEGSS